MIQTELDVKRQLAYFTKCVDMVETSEEIPPHPHSGFVHVSLIPTKSGDLESMNNLMHTAMEEGKFDTTGCVPGCKLCIDRALYNVVRSFPSFPSASYRTAQAILFRIAIFQADHVVYLPQQAERIVNQRMANIRKGGRGAPKSVSWPHGKYVRFIAGNEEYMFGSKYAGDEDEGGYHYFCVSAGGFDFQCVFEHIGKSRGLGPAMSEMTRLAMLCAAWKRHSGGFSINTPVLHPREVIVGPTLARKIANEMTARAEKKLPPLEIPAPLVPIEGVTIRLEGLEDDKRCSAYSVRSAGNQVYSSGHTELVCHLMAWMDRQRMDDESKLGWPRLVEAQQRKDETYYFEEEDDGIRDAPAEHEHVHAEGGAHAEGVRAAEELPSRTGEG